MKKIIIFNPYTGEEKIYTGIIESVKRVYITFRFNPYYYDNEKHTGAITIPKDWIKFI